MTLSSSQTVSFRSLAPQAAHRAVASAVETGLGLGAEVNAAVVDRGGNLLAFWRTAAAAVLAGSIAIDKAYTALSFGIPTSAWREALPPTSDLLTHAISSRARFTPFGGGVPIRLDGELVGAIGVSGGSEEQDVLCAQAAIAHLLAEQSQSLTGGAE